MAEENEEELDEESYDELDDDEFDPDEIDGGLEEDLDTGLDLGDLDEEPDDFPRGGGGGSTRDDDLVTNTYEDAVRANPKRQSMHRRRARVIEGVLDTAELNTPEGVEKAWQTLEKETSNANVKAYDIKAEYTENDVLEHPKFGVGYVVEILSQSKIAVLFEDGIKRLAYNR